MLPQKYRIYVERPNKDWLAEKLHMNIQDPGIDLITATHGVELKCQDAFWSKFVWPYDQREKIRHEERDAGKTFWLGLMKYRVHVRPTNIETVEQIAPNIYFRETWLVPWEFLDTLTPNSRSTGIWYSIKGSEFTAQYDFKEIQGYTDGKIYAPKEPMFQIPS